MNLGVRNREGKIMKDLRREEIIYGLVLAVAFIAIFLCVKAYGAEYRFTTISVPDSAHTMSFGINDLGDVVGAFIERQFEPAQGFLYSDGQYYELATAGATNLTPFGINGSGLIAGTLVNQGQFAFLMTDVSTTILDQAVRADAVNNRAVAVGYQSTPQFNQLAYSYEDGKYSQLVTPVDVPGILGSAATGINDKGDIVGYWFTDVDGVNVKITGFVRKAGKLNPIDLIPLGINTDGAIVGLSGAGNDGAILEDGVVTLIKVPGADYTQVHGINNKGTLVGYYVKAGINYGFVGKKVATDKRVRP